jgi:hypothetical protein
MATLLLTDPNELTLQLEGEAEDVILSTLRRWPHWLRATLEHDPDDPRRCRSVTLVAERQHEETVRLILEKSFGLRFPSEGGSQVFTPPPVPEKRHRRRW